MQRLRKELHRTREEYISELKKKEDHSKWRTFYIFKLRYLTQAITYTFSFTALGVTFLFQSLTMTMTTKGQMFMKVKHSYESKLSIVLNSITIIWYGNIKKL